MNPVSSIRTEVDIVVFLYKYLGDGGVELIQNCRSSLFLHLKTCLKFDYVGTLLGVKLGLSILLMVISNNADN